MRASLDGCPNATVADPIFNKEYLNEAQTMMQAMNSNIKFLVSFVIIIVQI